MDTVICKELIVSTIARRGNGELHSPVRVITQVFEKDGTLVAEHDPSPETYTLEDMFDLALWCVRNEVNFVKAKTVYIQKWLDEKSRLKAGRDRAT